MIQRKLLMFMSLLLIATTLAWGVELSYAKNPAAPGQMKKITQAERQAAADRAAAAGFTLPALDTAMMAMPGDPPHYFSHPNYANSPLPGNIVAEWNAIAQEIVQPTPMPGMPMPMSGTSMSTAFVYLSYIQAAVWDALVAIEGGYQPYNLLVQPNPSASREAAVATAAYNVLAHYFPLDPALAGKYAASLAAIPDSAAKTAGIAIGEQAAAGIITLRANDGLLEPDTYTLLPPGPGVWEPTVLPDGTTVPPIDPWMALLTPFTFQSPDQFRSIVGVPWALDSAQWAAEMNTVKDIGGAMSTTRTAEQTDIARFWTTNNVIQFNSAYRQIAADRGMNLLDTARLMAMGNMVGADALIACFDTKYHYSFWRPITAIQRADTDGNDQTVQDSTWMPLVMTPSFPEFVAGHSAFVSAQAEVLTKILGTDLIEIDLASLVTGQTRHYVSAAELRAEVNNARVWAGLHYPGSTTLGETLGQTVAQNALLTYFTADPNTDTGQHAVVSGGIRKFVDGLAGLDATNANNLGQYIPVAVPDTITYPGSDYYEIAVVQYREKMHSDLPPTLLRGYVQLSTSVVPGEQAPLTNALLNGTESATGYSGVTPPHYLGPTILATKDRPVRILFRNLLPTGIDGDLFIPVDVTVMGSGMGPNLGGMLEPDPQNPMCGMGYDMDGNRIAKDPNCFAENRATLHLHGGISPWISDGTPHQWTTPAGENTSYPEGVSVSNVPDMPDPGPGAITFFYTNQQSARLMFYHDHAWGITRLNVYAGEAAPYLITDEAEQTLITQGIIPGLADTIPLVVQDKTFVPSIGQLAVSDELWDMDRWGAVGNLWLPHVYSPAQNPGDSSGVNQFGRWAYGPWFWPPTLDIDYPPITNAYYDPNCNPDIQWCEPPLMPGTPYNSMGMEAFHDTPLVNGTAYPTVTVAPKAYRLRFLNAASDRFFNLSLYEADASGTEVALNPAEVAAALVDPAGVFPTPIAAAGPNWIQIGTEGGFLPAPVVIPPQPITWVTDPTVFNAGNVDQHSLLIGPAERADVIVDFSAYAGKTLILYNDAPAAFPARDPRYDYYTGNVDLRDTGGASSTLPGYGPNTRTVMQIVVAGNPAPAFDMAPLQAAFAHKADGSGVFESSQNPIIVGQGAYNTAYGSSFQNSGPRDGFARITDFSLTFNTLLGQDPLQTMTMPFQPKAIQDEMGEAFEKEYGRMSGNLGLEVPLTQAGVAQNLILYPYVNPASELINATRLPYAIDPNDPNYKVQPISVANDGTQIWKITHNGVDTHPIHFHLFDVQVINRVGWDGIIRPPDANELGWKDTVRISPLEDTIVALRPIIPVVPFDLPNSVRPLNPMMPLGSTLMFNSTDANANPTDPIVNELVNFGLEYVWHCHILSHEEMDMMRPISVAMPPKAPTALSGAVTGNGNNRLLILSWTDNSSNETSFIIQRANNVSFTTGLATFTTEPNVGTYTDPIGNTTQTFYYRVFASNTVGYTATPGFSSMVVDSGFSNITAYPANAPLTPPAAPSNVAATAVRQGNNARVTLTWTDNANNESGFRIQRATDPGFSANVVTSTVGANTTTFNTGNLARTTAFYFRVQAVNSADPSAWVNATPFPITTP